MTPVIGDPAPAFALRDQHGRTVALEHLAGRPAVLVFLPLAFSPTCTGELAELRDHVELFDRVDARVLGITVDSKAALRAWSEQERLPFPLLSDFWPHGAVARDYGVLLEEKGFAERATFVLDAAGIIRAAFRSEVGEPRTLQQYREALAAL